MAKRTTINISLTPELNEFVLERVTSGAYQTASEVIREALRLLQRQERERAEALDQVRLKLGKNPLRLEGSEALNGEQLWGELWELIQERRRYKSLNAQ